MSSTPSSSEMVRRDAESEKKYTQALEQKCLYLGQKIRDLRELVWMEDIPHPTVPEYKELHEKITKILTFIDSELIEKENVDE